MNMLSCVLLLLATVLCVCMSTEGLTPPGGQVQITQKALDYAANVAIDILSKDVQGKSIPDQTGEAHLKVGKVKYELTRMRISSWTRPSSLIQLREGQGLTWSASNAGLSLNDGHWHYKYKLGFISVSDSGSFDVSVSGVQFHVTVSFGVDSNGRLTMATQACSADVGNARVKFHGGASWLYNLFNGVAEDAIKRNLRNLMCSAAGKAIVKGNASLAKMKVKVPIGDVLSLDYRFMAPPTFTSNVMTTKVKGEVFWVEDQREAPFSAPPIPDLPGTLRMVNIGLSEYVFNTMGYSLQKIPEAAKGALAKNLTQDDLPAQYRSIMNTTCQGFVPCIGSVVPQVAKKYPNRVVNLRMRSTKAPHLSIMNGTIGGAFEGTIAFRIAQKNAPDIVLFVSNTTFNVRAHVEVKEEKIVGKIIDFHIKINITSSSIGPIKSASLQAVMNLLSKSYIVPQLNKVASKGFAIPNVDGVHFVKPTIVLGNRTIFINTDLKYLPDTTLYYQ